MENLAERPLEDRNRAAAPIREQLLDRKSRLAAAVRPGHPELAHLLMEVDSALERLDHGTWGVCERCHDPIESDRALADPLVRVCLGCLDEHEVRALERDLELAATIQASLLPSRSIRHDGWEIAHRYLAASQVSGDHFDVLLPDQPEGPVHFALGDVAGKGVAAALLMTHLRAALRALVGMRLPLDALVSRANRLLCEGTMASSYATLAIGRLHADGTIELVNAGHCPPVVRSAHGLASLPATGYPVGLFSGASWEVHRLRLAPGDVLFAYTDGLSEIVPDDGSYRDSSWIRDAVRELGKHEIAPLIEGTLAREAEIRGNAPRRDDLTVMAIRRHA